MPDVPERISNQPSSQNIPPAAPGLEGWQGVAAEYKSWHKGLHPYVEDNLARRGLHHLVNQGEASEIIDPTQGIQKALEDANTIHLDALMSSRTFLGRAKDEGVNTDYQGQDNPEYWDLLADVVAGYVNFRRREGDSKFLTESINLICRLPQFLLAQQRLDSYGDDQYDLKVRDKEVASKFNALLRTFFDAYPDTSIKGFTKELALITGYMFRSGDVRKRVVEQLNSSLRGAMHESAFRKILERSGYARTGIREATAQEDLQGIDIVVDPGQWDELCLDVKASIFNIQELSRKDGVPDWNRPFYPKPGHSGYTKRETGEYVPPRKDAIVIFSLLEDSWFGDRFTLSDQYVNEVAKILPDIIEESRTVLHNMRQQRQRHRRHDS